MNLQSSWTALDLGCGDAFYISKLLRESQLGKSLQHYVGVDMSRAALTYADKFLHEALPAETQVRQASRLPQTQQPAILMMLRKMPTAQARASSCCMWPQCEMLCVHKHSAFHSRCHTQQHMVACHAMQHTDALLAARCCLSS